MTKSMASRSRCEWSTAVAVMALLLQALLTGYLQSGGAMAAETASAPAAMHHAHGGADTDESNHAGCPCCMACVCCGPSATALPPVPPPPYGIAAAFVPRAPDTESDPRSAGSGDHRARGPPRAI